MTRMLLAAVASVAVLGVSAVPANAQMIAGFAGTNGANSGFARVGNGELDRRGFGDCFGGGFGSFRDGRDGHHGSHGDGGDGHSGHHGDGRHHNNNNCGDVVLSYYGGDWAANNNRGWDSDSYNDWWHDRPERAYPAWMRRNQDCQRPWFAGNTLTC